MAWQNWVNGLWAGCIKSEIKTGLELDILQNVDFGRWDLYKCDLTGLFVVTWKNCFILCVCHRVLQLGCHGSERCLHQSGPSGEKEIRQVQVGSGRVFQFVFQLAGAGCLYSPLFALSSVCGGEGSLLKWGGRARCWGLREGGFLLWVGFFCARNLWSRSNSF